MKSLLLFGIAFLLWFLALGAHESAPMASLFMTGLGGLICLIAIFVDHAEHTRRR